MVRFKVLVVVQFRGIIRKGRILYLNFSLEVGQFFQTSGNRIEKMSGKNVFHCSMILVKHTAMILRGFMAKKVALWWLLWLILQSEQYHDKFEDDFGF